jgi:hypothetical protein
MKKWLIGQAPLRKTPGGTFLLDVPPNAVIETTGRQQEIKYSGQEYTVWSEIKYLDKTGWIYDGFLEKYLEQFPDGAVEIPSEMATPNPYDAAQFVIIDGKVKTNLCGELCAAYLGGDSLPAFLAKWKVSDPSYYTWAVGGNRTTGLEALDSMLRVYGYAPPNPRFDNALRDPVIGVRISPARMQKMLETHALIAGVRITSSGNLYERGVGHWVVVESVGPFDAGNGWVSLYNPFPNKLQMYSYAEFIRSCQSWSGMWVERKHAQPSVERSS